MQAQRVDGTATAYNMLLQPNGGNVGIGTTAPLSKLQVNYDATINTTTPGQTAYGSIHILPSSSIPDNMTGITFGAQDQFHPPGQTGAQAGIYVQGSGLYGTKLYFATTDAFVKGAKTRMMNAHLGNVVIGTTTPRALFHITSGIANTNRDAPGIATII